MAVEHSTVGVFSAIVRLIDEIPLELMMLSGEDYDDLVSGVEAIRHVVAFWEQQGHGKVGQPSVGNKKALNLILAALTKCPDQIPAPATAELVFVTDPDLRDSIRLDVSTAISAFHNGEWKAATVLAGTAAEALLLWAIEKSPSLSTLTNKPKGSPDEWGLSQYIAVATTLSLIKNTTSQQATLAQNFRNLIHPGRSKRLGETCDRATALTAWTAVEHVIRDLS